MYVSRYFQSSSIMVYLRYPLIDFRSGLIQLLISLELFLMRTYPGEI
jgi:hypothetical protein